MVGDGDVQKGRDCFLKYILRLAATRKHDWAALDVKRLGTQYTNVKSIGERGPLMSLGETSPPNLQCNPS